MPYFGRWKRPWLIIVIGTVLASALLSTYGYYRYKQHHHSKDEQASPLHNLIGQYRPGFELQDINGKSRNIDEWNNRVLVINFWAAWCKPCRHEIPLFTHLQKTYEKQGLQFIGVAIDEKSAVNDFISGLGTPINYPILLGQDDAIRVAKQYGNEFGVLPYSVIIDRKGHIDYIQFGEFPRDAVEYEINTLLGI